MSNGYLVGCGLIISFIITIIFFIKKSINNFETTIFKNMLITNLFESLTTCSIVIVALTSNSIFAFEILNRIDVVLIVTWCSLFFIYMFGIVKNEKLNVMKKFVFFLNFIFFIFSLFLKVNIISTGDVLDSNGPLITLCFVISCLYIFGMIFLVLFNYKKFMIQKIKMLPVIFLLCMLCGVTLLRLYLPRVNFVSLIFSLIDMIMMFTIENPDVKMIKQLELAKDQADKANRAKTDFLSSMSHEIRTPLNAITGFSDCVLNSNTLDEAKENAKDIITASNTLLEIVNGILDISKIEAGKLEIVNSPYDALELFSNLGKLIKPRMAEKGLDFQIYIAPDLPRILYGDHANVKKVVTNLLSNACKYTDRGYVRYDVNCVNNENSTRLIISVEDSGRGIKKENIDKLFTKFQRLEEDRNTTIEGTGLGLAITKQLVELMGGKVVVHSIYGQGSKFTIILDQKIEKEVNIVKNVDNNKNNNFDLNGYRILIVDDNQLNLKVASKLLMRYNATIVCCESGFDCINLLKNDTSFDIILMDDMMPKMSGSETLHKIKQMPGIDIPIIALTANAISGMREKYISDGFDDYLAKPIEKLEMIRVFNDLVLCKEPISKSSNISSQKNDDIEQLEDTAEIPKIGNFNKEQFLRENGIDLDKALEFLGDMEMYDMTVKDYLSEIDNKITDLTRFKLEKDISNYAILVHSMKSDAKYLGLMEFASKAYKHELESKAGNISYVEENFEDLMKNLRKWLIVIKKYSQNI